MMIYNVLNTNRSIKEYEPIRVIGKYITYHAESIRAGARIGLVALVSALAGFLGRPSYFLFARPFSFEFSGS